MFFGFHQIGLALINLIIILIFIILIMKIYFKKNKTSFYLINLCTIVLRQNRY